ncbi:hypothetical protein R6Q59_014871 [Mikania micrantha]
MLFNDSKQRNILTWNSMVSGYVRQNEITKPRQVFDEMPERDTMSWNTMISGGECPIELVGSCRNKVQVYWFIRTSQLHTLLHFHLTPIVMINDLSCRDLLLNSQKFCGREPLVVLVVLQRGYGEVRIGEHSSWGG